MKTCQGFPLWHIPTRAISLPTNKQVNKINNMILLKFKALIQVYYLVDTAFDRKEAVHCSTEFLNSLKSSGSQRI